MPILSGNQQGITIKLQLELLDSVKAIPAMRKTMEQFRQACNFISDYIFNNNFEMNQIKIQKAIYSDIRSIYKLKSMMAQSAIRATIARYKTVKTQLIQNPYKYKDTEDLDEKGNPKWKYISKTLEWLYKPINFKRPSVDLVRNRDWSKLSDGTLSINTLEGRILARPICSEYFEQYFSKDWKLGGAKLLESNGKWYLHISATKAVEELPIENICHVVGIDRGLRFHAVTYDEKGKTNFYSGKEARTIRKKYNKVRAQLQAKGTKSAKRALKRISGRENRWMTDVNHRLSKTLVEKYGSNTLFVIEDLAGVTFEESNLNGKAEENADKRSWAFYQLEQFLNYKAILNNSAVLKVSAQYTSQRCPKCGSICKENRDHHRHLYSCKCGYKSNDDRI